jgi:group I intron endonuclease
MGDYLVYKHTSPSGKSYIGQTKDYDKRCNQHKLSTGCRAINSAINKYGWDNFTHEILIEGLSLDEANRWEEVLIKELNTLAPNGYNLRTGGANSSPSEETKSKISEAKKGHTYSDEARRKMSADRKGIPKSDEARANMSDARKGVPKSDEARANMSKVRQGKKREPHSEETRAKISSAHKGKIIPDEARANMSAARVGKKRGPYKIKQIEPTE